MNAVINKILAGTNRDMLEDTSSIHEEYSSVLSAPKNLKYHLIYFIPSTLVEEFHDKKRL